MNLYESAYKYIVNIQGGEKETSLTHPQKNDKLRKGAQEMKKTI